ncbi:B-cell antigen receptor complex-associated protein alpha chain isoform X2 [Nothobranchius furzeri]|uniref:B-cell antigen receptor complex-associated protein alpha chain isoform X2 n=1 Tax=Nothobranchius furzeri TaxID=105023 RepID=UPI003904A373
MGVVVFLVLCSVVGGLASEQVILDADRPFLRVQLYDTATLKCCYKGGSKFLTWIKRDSSAAKNRVKDTVSEVESDSLHCSTLTFDKVELNDTGLYQCYLNKSKVETHGTYMQVYKPMEKTINLSESTKNTILMFEGFLLLLCVIVPSSILLFKSRSLKQLEMKKMKQEEENIYQGLNLDECCTTYDQIERSQAHGAYQDVGNCAGEGEAIQLEKP